MNVTVRSQPSAPQRGMMWAMAHLWERRPSATGSRLHWVRAGQPHALCGSVVVHAAGRVTPHPVKHHDCAVCSQKYAGIQRIGHRSARTTPRQLR